MFVSNRYMKRWGLVIVAVTTVGVTAACFGARMHDPAARIDFMAGHLAKDLALNDAQKAQLKAITDEMKADAKARAENHEDRKAEIEKLVMAKQLDQAAVKKHIADMQARMNGNVDRYLDKIAALHATLSDEQKKKLVAHLERMAAWHHGHHRHHGGGDEKASASAPAPVKPSDASASPVTAPASK